MWIGLYYDKFIIAKAEVSNTCSRDILSNMNYSNFKTFDTFKLSQISGHIYLYLQRDNKNLSLRSLSLKDLGFLASTIINFISMKDLGILAKNFSYTIFSAQGKNRRVGTPL